MFTLRCVITFYARGTSTFQNQRNLEGAWKQWTMRFYRSTHSTEWIGASPPGKALPLFQDQTSLQHLTRNTRIHPKKTWQIIKPWSAMELQISYFGTFATVLHPSPSRLPPPKRKTALASNSSWHLKLWQFCWDANTNISQALLRVLTRLAHDWNGQFIDDLL